MFINQLREKIGVIYGCFHYNARVVLADGTTEKIGKIVNQKMPVEVLSYDAKSGAMVPKRVVNWFDNGVTEEFLQITVAKPAKNGRAQLACTPNHLIRTPGGWVEAGELKVGDRVLEALPHYLSEFQMTALRGTLMGDGALSPTRSGRGARFRYTHCEKQTDYADWKASLFANVESSRFVRDDKVVTYDFQPHARTRRRARERLRRGQEGLRRRLPEVADPAVAGAVVHGRRELHGPLQGRPAAHRGALRARGHLRGGDGGRDARAPRRVPGRHLGNPGRRCVASGAGKKAILVFNNAETAKLQALIAPYVHPSMEYKLLPRFRGRFRVEPAFEPPRYELMAMPVTDVRVKPPDALDAPVRHRGRGQPQLPRRRRDGAQLARGDPGRARAEVLLVDSPGHSAHRVDQGRH